MGIGDTRLAEMEDGRRQHRAGMTLAHPFDQMVKAADPARRYHRHRHGIGNPAGEREVIAVARAVAVHRGHEQFARAQSGELHRMGERINAGGYATPVGENFPPAWLYLPRVDGGGDALAAKAFGNVRNQFGARNRGAAVCTNRATIGREDLEERVLGGLHDRLMHPELFAAFVEAGLLAGRQQGRRVTPQRS